MKNLCFNFEECVEELEGEAEIYAGHTSMFEGGERDGGRRSNVLGDP